MAEKMQDMLGKMGMKAYSTTIAPKPPFFLFVPNIKEVNPELKNMNRSKAFALGTFFGTNEEALKEVKKAGYNKSQQNILKEQGYLAFKGEW